MPQPHRPPWPILSLWLLLCSCAHAFAIADPFHPDMQVAGISCHHPHSMDFDIQQASRDAVLWDIARCAQKNVQLHTTIKGTISLQAKDIEPDQALTVVLDAQAVSLKKVDHWWHINDHKQSQHWHRYTLHHIDANTLHKAWQQSEHAIGNTRSPGMPDNLHNQWWLYCDDAHWKAMQPWLQAWDRPTPQVAIRATIMQVDAHTMASLGILLQNQHPHTHQGTPAILNTNAINVGIVKLGLQQVLSATLQAAAESGHAQMIASPHLLTLNHQAATIETGDQIPYAEKTIYGDSSTTFKKAVLKLAVTPHVLDQNNLQLDITLTQDQVNPLHEQQSPSIQTRSLKTKARLQNGHTLILGGIEQQHHHHNQHHTPGLSGIPILGNLFKQKQQQQQQQQLVLLITPMLQKNSMVTLATPKTTAKMKHQKQHHC